MSLKGGRKNFFKILFVISEKSSQLVSEGKNLTNLENRILNHTYEYTMREDIVMCMEELELEPEKARALLRSPCPLSDVYKEFRDRETEHMDTIRDSIETEADKSLQRQEKKQQRESR